MTNLTNVLALNDPNIATTVNSELEGLFFAVRENLLQLQDIYDYAMVDDKLSEEDDIDFTFTDVQETFTSLLDEIVDLQKDILNVAREG